jgi:hypothetical protein
VPTQLKLNWLLRDKLVYYSSIGHELLQKKLFIQIFDEKKTEKSLKGRYILPMRGKASLLHFLGHTLLSLPIDMDNIHIYNGAMTFTRTAISIMTLRRMECLE